VAEGDRIGFGLARRARVAVRLGGLLAIILIIGAAVSKWLFLAFLIGVALILGARIEVARAVRRRRGEH
jgi:hypothetical protein